MYVTNESEYKEKKMDKKNGNCPKQKLPKLFNGNVFSIMRKHNGWPKYPYRLGLAFGHILHEKKEMKKYCERNKRVTEVDVPCVISQAVDQP